MRNVLTSTIIQPAKESPLSNRRKGSLSTCQITPPIGSHFQKRRSNAALAASTKVLRSIGLGTIFVQTALNPCRAITLCCSAKMARSTASVSSAAPSGPAGAESIDFGTTRSATKPIA